jgi:hypothetical protein
MVVPSSAIFEFHMMQQRVLRYDQSADPTIAKSVFFRTRTDA